MMLMPAALMLLYSAECTVGHIAHISSEECRSSETGKVRTPGLLPESRLQNGSPIVIMGPKLSLPPSPCVKPASLFTCTPGRRLDSAVGMHGGTTASANVFTPTSGGASTSATGLPVFLSLGCTSTRHGPELNRQWSAKFLGCRVGC